MYVRDKPQRHRRTDMNGKQLAKYIESQLNVECVFIYDDIADALEIITNEISNLKGDLRLYQGLENESLADFVLRRWRLPAFYTIQAKMQKGDLIVYATQDKDDLCREPVRYEHYRQPVWIHPALHYTDEDIAKIQHELNCNIDLYFALTSEA